MYTLTKNDRLEEIKELPQSDVGAPCPMILASENGLAISFMLSDIDPKWDGTSIRIVDQNSLEPVILVKFTRIYAHMFGPPNDEALHGHPLHSRGLTAYSYFIVHDSSWIAKCIEMNSVHSMHNDQSFTDLKHYIFTFHDSVFECLAHGYTFEVSHDSVANALLKCKLV